MYVPWASGRTMSEVETRRICLKTRCSFCAVRRAPDCFLNVLQGPVFINKLMGSCKGSRQGCPECRSGFRIGIGRGWGMLKAPIMEIEGVGWVCPPTCHAHRGKPLNGHPCQPKGKAQNKGIHSKFIPGGCSHTGVPMVVRWPLHQSLVLPCLTLEVICG